MPTGTIATTVNVTVCRVMAGLFHVIGIQVTNGTGVTTVTMISYRIMTDLNDPGAFWHYSY